MECVFKLNFSVDKTSKVCKTVFNVDIFGETCVLWVKQFQFHLVLCSAVWFVRVCDTCSAVAQTDPVSTFAGAWLKLGRSSWNTFHPFPLSHLLLNVLSLLSLSLSFTKKKAFWWTVKKKNVKKRLSAPSSAFSFPTSPTHHLSHPRPIYLPKSPSVPSL